MSMKYSVNMISRDKIKSIYMQKIDQLSKEKHRPNNFHSKERSF